MSAVPPQLGALTKNPAVMTHVGKKPASLILGTVETYDTFYLDNGGISGAGYLTKLSPCNSEVHSAPLCGQVFTGPCSLFRLSGAYSSSSKLLFINFA
jgi:hypothetical protein